MEAEIAVRIESGSSEQARSVKLCSTQAGIRAGAVAGHDRAGGMRQAAGFWLTNQDCPFRPTSEIEPD